jgi:hypothetical protein
MFTVWGFCFWIICFSCLLAFRNSR